MYHKCPQTRREAKYEVKDETASVNPKDNTDNEANTVMKELVAKEESIVAQVIKTNT